MASGEPVPSRPLAAAHVGALFVREYYSVLCEAPSRVHKFYKAQSVFSWGVEGAVGAEVASAIGSDEIHHEIMSLVAHAEKNACAVDVIGVDSQESKTGGIMVFVTGRMKFMNNPRRPWHFNQVFFLDRQTDPYDGYFVLNDIMRYIVVPESEEKAAVRSPSTGQPASPPTWIPKAPMTPPVIKPPTAPAPTRCPEPAPSPSNDPPAAQLAEPPLEAPGVPEAEGASAEEEEEHAAGPSESGRSDGDPGPPQEQPHEPNDQNEQEEQHEKHELLTPIKAEELFQEERPAPTWASMARRLGDGGSNLRASKAPIAHKPAMAAPGDAPMPVASLASPPAPGAAHGKGQGRGVDGSRGNKGNGRKGEASTGAGGPNGQKGGSQHRGGKAGRGGKNRRDFQQSGSQE